MNQQFSPSPQGRLVEKSNPNATIGFVIFYPFQFYVYKNIYKQLAPDAEFIVDLGVYRPVRQPDHLVNDIVTLLRKHDVSFRILYYEDYFYDLYLEEFFGRYKALVTVWERGCVLLKQAGHTKKVNATYGAGKELTAVRPSQGLYDLVLAYGERMARLHGLFTRTVIVGNPKFDDWFTGAIDESEIVAIKGKLSGQKKTILYLPTHSDLSSVDQLADEIKRITGKYNVIVKLHYYTPREEPERVRKLTSPGILIVQDDTDLLPLLKVADVVVSDNSSAIFDAILADKPTVVTDFWDEEYLDVEHKERKMYLRGTAGALTYSGSIEQVVKQKGWVHTLQTPDNLTNTIEEALQDSDHFRVKRADLRRELFGYIDGHSAERSANAIRDCIVDPASSSRAILHHAFEAHKRTLGVLSFRQERMLRAKITHYESFLSERITSNPKKYFFSIVLFCYREAIEDEIAASLQALLEQRLPFEDYEIIVVAYSSVVIREILKNIPQVKNGIPTIKYLDLGEDSVGRVFALAFDQAKGDIVCFTQSSVVMPSNWLLNLSLAYEQHSDVAGVGGYVINYHAPSSIFDEYYYLELAKKQGLEKYPLFLDLLYEEKNDLFYQNPAGTLTNMSYKKEFLTKSASLYRGLNSLLLVEHLMKLSVIKQGYPICFIPSRAHSLEKMTLKKFIRKNFDEGLAHYHLCKTDPSMIMNYLPTAFSVVKLPLINILDGQLKGRLSVVIFVGALFRWLGKLYGITVIQMLHFRIGKMTASNSK